jgi:N-acetylglutamate synthase-like GNAT family acetyltransferase
VLTRDDAVLACAMLKRYAPDCAELGCLVVSPRYRKEGRGDSMLSFLEVRHPRRQKQHATKIALQ